jgi:heme a synthase
MTSPHPLFPRIAWIAVALALGVIVFGAFVRLSHAGLSCPDWPTCYGQATWPTQAEQIARANEAFPQRQVETGKHWREQLHRHLAAALGLLVAALALLAARSRRGGVAVVLASCAAVALAIPLYMRGLYLPSSLLVLAAEATLLGCAWRWRGGGLTAVSLLTLAVIIFQAMLGMWTVTWLLKPVVVLAHLLGGLGTFALLTFIAWRSLPSPVTVTSSGLRRLSLLALAVLTLQIALGGWVSANYAALACGVDFPTCLGQWWPPTDFREAFVLWRGIGVDYEGGVLDGPARAAIQLSHRVFALLVLAVLGLLAWRLQRWPALAGWGMALAAALLLQFGLGIANVLLALPLALATAHNAGAVLLVFILVSLLARFPPTAVR